MKTGAPSADQTKETWQNSVKLRTSNLQTGPDIKSTSKIQFWLFFKLFFKGRTNKSISLFQHPDKQLYIPETSKMNHHHTT